MSHIKVYWVLFFETEGPGGPSNWFKPNQEFHFNMLHLVCLDLDYKFFWDYFDMIDTETEKGNKKDKKEKKK